MIETETYIGVMQDSLTRKKKYLNDILDVTLEQGKYTKVDTFDEDVFIDLVNKKEILIANVNEIDKGFTSVYDRVRTEVLDNKDSYKEELVKVQNLIRECVEIGMRIEAEEERNRMSMEQIFASKFKGLRQVKQSKSVANKYYKSMSNGMVNDSILYDTKK